MNRYLTSGLALLALGASGAGGGYILLRPHDHLAAARALLERGALRAGALELRTAVIGDPSNAEAHYRLGLLDLRLGNPIAAETELGAAQDRGWDPDAIRAPLAEALVAQGRDAEVLQRFTPEGLPPGQGAAVRVQRSAAELRLGQVAAARAEAEAARRQDPGSARAAVAAAQAARAGGDEPAAARAVAGALALDPRAADALLLDAELRSRRGDTRGALQSLDAAVAAAPLWLPPRLLRAQALMGLRRDAAARADIDAVLQQQARSPMANFLLAELLARAGNYAAADAALDLIGPALRELPRGEYLQAIVKANLNEPEQAIEAANGYLARAPGDAAAIRLAARLDLALHQPLQAADLLGRAVAAGQADAETLTLLSAADATAGQPAAAIASMRRVAALRPNDFTALAQLGVLRLDAGDPAGAAADLSRALALHPVSDTPAPGPAAPPAALSAEPSAAQPAGPLVAPPAAAGSARPQASPSVPAATEAQAAAALVTAALRAGEPDTAAAALDRLRRLGAPPAQIAELDGEVKVGKLDFAGALSAFAEAHRLDPAGVRPQLQTARVLVLQGRQADAEQTLGAAVKAWPHSHEALSAYVAVLVGQGKTAQAVTVMQAAHAAAPADEVVAIGLSDFYIRTGQASRALTLLDDLEQARATTAQTSAPASGSTRAQHGAAGVGTAGVGTAGAGAAGAGAAGRAAADVAAAGEGSAVGQSGSGGSAGEDSASRESASGGADGIGGDATPQAAQLALLAARSRALVAAGNRDDAIPLVRHMLATRPGDLALRTQLIGLMLAEGDIPAAQSVIQDGLAGQPNNPSLLYAAVVAATKAGGLQAGLDLADRLAKAPGTGTAGKLLKGNLLMAQKHYADAAAAYAAYIGSEPSPAFPVRAAEALVADRRVGDARQLLRSWLAGHGTAPDAAMLLGSLDLAEHDTQAARTLFQDVLDTQPDNAAALNNLAWIEQQSHELGSARGLAQRSWLLAPSPDTADTLGWILLQAGEPVPALDLLRLAAQGRATNPTVQLHYALALRQAGQRDAAKAILTRLTATPTEFDGKAEARRALGALAAP